MKRNHTPVILFCATGMLFFSCCKPDKEIVGNPYQDHTMPKEMYDYGYFLPGTYWVYEDSVTGDIDSVWVTFSKKQFDTLTNDNSNGLDPGIYDWFNVRTTSTHFNADYFYWCNSSRVTNDISYPMYREIISPSLIAETRCFRYQYEIGKLYYGVCKNLTTDSQKCVAFLDNVLLNSNIFPKVIAYSQTSNYSEDCTQTCFYFSRNYGIVRKEIPERNEVWNLIRYNIAQ